MAKRSKGRVKVGVSSSARGASRKGRGRGDAEADVRTLPALESLAHVPAFDDLAPTEAQVEAYRAYVEACGGDAELDLGFVCRLDRNFPAIRTAQGLVRAEHAERIFKGDLDRPVVGDWVVVRDPEGHDVCLIEDVLPRRGALVRWRGNRRGVFQVLAANVDLVLVAQPVGRRSLSLDRIVRSAVVAADSGSRFGVILTKADRAATPGDLAYDVASVRGVLGDDVVVVALAAGADEGDAGDVGADGAEGAGEAAGAEEARVDLADLEDAAREAGALWGEGAVREVVPPGTLALLLGESGAGKSTLLNSLLDDDVLETNAVRGADDAGRHTTVARRMVKLPDAGVIIDCPGLRSLPLVGHERGLGEVFPELQELAGQCRFRDCTHSGEPGCAICEALDAGEVARPRVDAYLSLAGEMRIHADSLDPDVRL